MPSRISHWLGLSRLPIGSINGAERSNNLSPPPPKTPLTTMRDVMSSISKDRSEIDGARRGDLFGNEVVRDEGGGHAPNASGAPLGGAAASEWDGDDAEVDEDYIGEVDNDDDDDSFYRHRRFDSASCLPYGSEVVLRFRNPHTLTSLSIPPRGDGTDATGRGPGGESKSESKSRGRLCFVANEAHGRLGGIGRRGENRFVLVRETTDVGAGGLGRLPEGEEARDEDDPSRRFLRYGDRVTLRSGAMKRVLGVQKEKLPAGASRQLDPEAPAHRLEVGCFRREGRFPQANQWTVLRGGAKAPVVQLGPIDVTSACVEEDGRVPVYSGDPVVLRNDWTGGILSLGEECQPAGLDNDGVTDDVVAGWSLEVLTSSYQMNDDGAASTEEDLPLIEYLHQHNRCRPRKTETFQIFAADVPHCPDWAYPTNEGLDRMYLSGTYLNYPERHVLESEMEAELFPEANYEEGNKRGDWPRLAELSADVQERVLLDEVIGAMMGQEGHFLRFRPPEEDEEEEEGSKDDGGFAAEPVFGLAPPSVLGGEIDTSVENILSRILPLCTHYPYVDRHVQSCLNNYECGAVARTLCEAMGELLEEYLAFVADLDYLSRGEPSAVGVGGGLSLSMVHVRAQPSLRTMAILATVTSTVRGKKGGELLNALHDLASTNYSGDGRAGALLRHLLARSAAPYVAMLRSWLERGRVHDPHGEFMIEVTDRSFRENHAGMVRMQQGLEWKDWCRLREDHVVWSLHDANDDALLPLDVDALGGDRSRDTLHMSALQKAHATGKYWRAIHCCRDGTAAPNPQTQKKENKLSEEDARVLLNPLKLSRRIDGAYHEASHTLLRMLLDEHGLLLSLRFMKNYFLLDKGDFFVDFLDGAEDELHKELPNVLRGRVQNWLSTSIARTSDSSSHLASALRCAFQNKGLRDTLDDLGRRNPRGSSRRKGCGASRQKALSGFEAIAFEFRSVPFPTSIVLSHSQLRIYQLIFRLIFFAKYVERQLVGMWSDHQLLKAMTSLRSACSPTFLLRRRMLHFIQNFVYYIKFDVIEPNWRELEGKLNATREYCRNERSAAGDENDSTAKNGNFPRTMDDLLHEHNQFLLRISNQCLLPNYDLIERASKIMTTCLLFSTQIKRFMETTKVHELHEKTRLERSRLRYSDKKSKDGEREAEFRKSREESTRRCADRILRELNTETYRHMITRFDEVFSAHLAEFMKNLNSDFGQKSNAHLTNLSMQLDYNGFLSSSIYGQE